MNYHACTIFCRLFSALALTFCVTVTMAQLTFNIDAGRRGPAIGDRHYGLFFEEINHAGDGGLYAELIRNRSFEDNSGNPDHWSAVGQASLSLTTRNLLNEAQGHALEVSFKRKGDGLCNDGFWGINVIKGQTYRLSLWIKGKSAWRGTLTASLTNGNGVPLGSTDIEADVRDQWTRLTAEIIATGTAGTGKFMLRSSTSGTIVIDVVSLFPPTYKDRDNGCRKDLAEMLEAMKPSFVRFPGGCYVEGFSDGTATNRFEWKKTIGPLEERPGHLNKNWGYRVSDGFGFHEMLQLTEDLGAEPLFVVNMGMGHSWAEDYNNIDAYIQEALDAIEYCNGDAKTTKWGALRARNGHPEPFNLRLMEIGNENYNYTSDSNKDQSDHYAERYEQFRKAIKTRYPEVTLIGNVEAWGTDAPAWRNVYPVEVVDEHYYRNPAWFVSQYNKYDSYSRASHKVYVGEYAVTSGYGVNGHLTAALGEAVFMLGMENNSDVCVMNSYAPIFVNENNYNWKPDMIRFNSYTSFGTPSYYVQKLFATHTGRENVKWTEQDNAAVATGNVGLSTWNTKATFDNAKVTDSEGNVIFSDDFSSPKPEWSSEGGTWKLVNGRLVQSDDAMQGKIYRCNINPGQRFTFEVDATRTRGAEGFLIVFNYEDSNNYCWWNIGGWSNTKHAVEQCVNGTKTTLASVSGSISTSKTYHIKISVDGTDVKCYLDNTLIHALTLPVPRKVYISSNIDDDNGILYLKMVNPGDTPRTAGINLAHASVTDGTAIVLSSTAGTDENSLSEPQKVVPAESPLHVSGQHFSYTLPAYSLNILRLNVKDISVIQEEPDPLPSPVLQYGFEDDGMTGDAHSGTGSLEGGASIVTMDDGNRALYTGSGMTPGYAILGQDAIRNCLSRLSGDYTVSIDVALRGTGNLDKYCWLYAFCAKNGKYAGLANTPGNTGWYYTIKDDTGSRDVKTGSGLSYGVWHNITYTQSGTTGRIYIDGFPAGQQLVPQSPALIAPELTGAFIGRSPFADDALLADAFIDNFRIYDSALDAGQAKQLYNEIKKRPAQSSEVSREADSGELSAFLQKFNFLHTTTSLPARTSGGSSVTWTYTSVPGMEDLVSLHDRQLTVNSLPEGTAPVHAGTLTAIPGDDASRAITHSVMLAPDDNRHGYLYCFMNPASEITNFALGTREDKGRVFNVLLDGGEIFDTYRIAGIEHGTRDAFIGRGQDGDGYFITTTDMKQQASGVWRNKGLNLVRSKDLIHWESTTFNFTHGKSVFSDPDARTGVYNTDEEYARINRVWAPQFIWDKDYNNGQGAYLVYYSLLSSNSGDNHDRIFYSYTDRAFRTLTQPRLLFDPGISVIDADIVYNPYDSLYHMYYKREGASGTERGIYEATGRTLTGGIWKEIMHVTNEGSEQVEGSSTIRRINEDVYNLYYMRYSGGNAYKYCETDHAGLNPTGSAALRGSGNFQHGSFMTVDRQEYTMLQAWSDVSLLLPRIKSMKAASGSTVFDAAIDQATGALALTTIDELATALPAALRALHNAVSLYKEELGKNAAPESPADFTFLLANPSFSNGSAGWTGTAFTAASGGVAEFYDKTFDTFQILDDMPAGTYRLQAQGFYRYGDYPEAYTAHRNGDERLLATLYLNEASQPFMSLFDASAPYTYTPYTYPNDISSAGKAFNTDHAYSGNAVTCILNEKGRLQTGLRKESIRAHDWNCFDNFKLYYLGKPSGISEVSAGASAVVDVYTADGIKIRSKVNSAEAAKGLAKGIYIIGKNKIIVR